MEIDTYFLMLSLAYGIGKQKGIPIFADIIKSAIKI